MSLEKPVVLLDEPFAAIEPIYQEKIIEYIGKAKHNNCFIISDHNYRIVQEVVDRAYLLKDGVLTEVHELHSGLQEKGYLPGKFE